MLRTSRVANYAVKDDTVVALPARSLSSVDLLHPIIADEALPEIDRGPDHFDTAVFKVFKAVEVAVRQAVGLTGDEKSAVQLMNAAFGPTGRLRDQGADVGEAEGLRNLFAGAFAVYRNPVSHRYVNERDPQQAMRLLSLASVLLSVVEARSVYLTGSE